jgi:molecular chaperone Hsp33
MAAGDDLIRPFQLDPFALRGRLVRLGPAIDAIIRRHGYPPPVASLLGQAAALATLLAGALKYDGIFTLQTKSDGPVRLLMADCTSDGAIRAYAQYDADAVAAAEASPGAEVPRLLGAGYLAFTVDQGEHTDRYQGIVELEGATLSECTHHYFRQSEQIEAGIVAAAAEIPGHGWRAGGIMLQRMPAEGGADAEPAGFDEDARDDGWRRAMMLLGSCSEAELTAPGLAADDLLYRLFSEDGVRVFPSHHLADRCRCSRERIETVLGHLTPEERTDMVVDGNVRVTCEFCSTEYLFSEAAVARL